MNPNIAVSTYVINIGNLVGGIISLPFSSYRLSPTQEKKYFACGATNDEEEKYVFELFDQYLKNNEKVQLFPYLFAVTANRWQQDARRVLEQNNFRIVMDFLSSHSDEHTPNAETLTLWTKIQDVKINEEKIKEFPLYQVNLNCSISTNRAGFHRCNITSKGPQDTDESLKALGFLRVKNTPIYFKIDEKWIVKPKKQST